MQIGRNQTDNLSTGSGLGQHVPIAAKHITQAHAVAIRQTSGTNDMSCEVNGPMAVRQDRFNANPGSLPDLELVDRIPISLQVLCAVIVQSHRYALLMAGVNAFDSDVAERFRGGKAARVPDD